MCQHRVFGSFTCFHYNVKTVLFTFLTNAGNNDIGNYDTTQILKN